MRFLRAEWRKGLALVAAMLFVVQALGTGFALASGTVALDAFGNPLCITGTEHGVPDGSGDHGKMPGCCMLGCGVASSLATPSDAASVPVRFANEFKAFAPKVRDVFAPRDEHDPGSPRAPPAFG